MGIEIERKFLVKNETFKDLAQAEIYHQGFLSTNKERVVRVRISSAHKAWLTIKGLSQGVSRPEYEYAIPVTDAEFILNNLCKKPTIVKKRYHIPIGKMMWEVDEFENENEGLVLAEIELSNEQQVFEIPEWIGKEVTGEKKYYNVFLIKHPYKTWK